MKSTSTGGIQEENHRSQNCTELQDLTFPKTMKRSLMHVGSTFFGQMEPK